MTDLEQMTDRIIFTSKFGEHHCDNSKCTQKLYLYLLDILKMCLLYLIAD